MAPLLAPDGDLVVLVKPQFEAGRGEVGKGGIVRDGAVQDRVLDEATRAADALGLTRVALQPGSLVVNSSQGGGSKDTWVLRGED